MDEFEQQVRDCLMHLYDYAFLQDHPLVDLLVPKGQGTDQVHDFQELITKSVGRLKPVVEVVTDSKPSRLYNILLLRYIEQRPTHEVIDQLALSERQFYRDHPKAVQALSDLLWEKAGVVDQAAFPMISVASEIQRSSQSGSITEIALDEELHAVLEVARSLAAQHQVAIHLRPQNEAPLLPSERTIFRQTIIGILSWLITGSQPGSQLEITHYPTKRQYHIAFVVTSAGDMRALQDGLAQHHTLHHLTSTLNAAIRCEIRDGGQFQATLTLPFSPRTVLAIDDNPDVIALFRRYLADGSHRLLAARTGEQALDIARSMQPDIILLDLMLSGQDGFEILQNLKHHPATQHIPVLVCSVLNESDIAYSLGANDYLKKPPGREDFLRALARWQG